MGDAHGYDTGFLGIDVPLPRPGDGRATYELAYPHFTVVLDRARRLAAVTAVNIDGAQLRDIPRTGEWHLDERIPGADQTGPDVYRGNDLDRGHLVRRRDPGWGEPAQARTATEATFSYTNAAPQAAAFNQSKELWLGLEDHVLAYADASRLRLSVFTAPVLDDDDPPYRGIRVPRRFWKIAAWTTGPSDAPGLRAAAFVLDQTDLIPAATAVAEPLGPFRTFQVPVGDIAGLTGIELGPLVAADVLPASAWPGGWRDVDRAEELVLRG